MRLKIDNISVDIHQLLVAMWFRAAIISVDFCNHYLRSSFRQFVQSTIQKSLVYMLPRNQTDICLQFLPSFSGESMQSINAINISKFSELQPTRYLVNQIQLMLACSFHPCAYLLALLLNRITKLKFYYVIHG